MSTTLKPCPFCGSAAILDGTTYKHHQTGKHYYAIGCRTQGCFAYVHNFSAAVPESRKDELVESWNRRGIDDVPDSPGYIDHLEHRIERMNEVLGKTRMTCEVPKELYAEIDDVMTREVRT